MRTLTFGEAFTELNALQKRLEKVMARVRENAFSIEGEEPGENIPDLLTELDNLLEQRRDLLIDVRTANGSGIIGDMSMAEFLARKQIEERTSRVWRTMIDSLLPRRSGWGTEVDYSQINGKANKLKEAIDNRKAQLQAFNWTNSLKTGLEI